jgi:hypothetical protein
MKFHWLVIGLLSAHLDGTPARSQPLLFTPERGFAGTSEGEGAVTLFLGRPRPFHVRSVGQSEEDGSFTLHQIVAFDGQDPTTRTWSIRPLAPLRYTGTLSDAAGPVSGHTSGNTLVLKYRVKGPVTMHQTLHLMRDGRTIENRGRITLLGIPVGSLREIIRRGR